MNDGMDFEAFRQYVYRQEFMRTSVLSSLMDIIERHIDNKDEIREFYPKNLFIDDEKLKVYAFMPSEVISFEIEEQTINVKHQKYSWIEKLQITYTKEYRPKPTLLIEFTSGDQIVLNGHDDTNEHWAPKFSEKIINIVKIVS